MEVFWELVTKIWVTFALEKWQKPIESVCKDLAVGRIRKEDRIELGHRVCRHDCLPTQFNILSKIDRRRRQ